MPLTSLTFGGNETFTAPPAVLFARLTDLDQLAATMPGLQSSQRVDDHTLDVVLRPGFAFLRGTMRARVSIVDAQPPESAKLTVAANGIGLSMRMESVLKITPIESGSRLDWTATVLELTGLVATLSRPLIAGAAGQLIANAWRRVHESLGEK